MLINTDRYKFHSPKKKKHRKRFIILCTSTVAVLSIVLFMLLALPVITGRNIKIKPSEREIIDLWNAGLYNETIQLCNQILAEHPMDHEPLMFYGFSKYYRAFYEKALEDKIPLLDDSIRALRRAKLIPHFENHDKADYILGQVYYHKGKFYYDLSIKYIEKSIEEGYIGIDAYEYLGLAYGGIGETEKELEYFLKALKKNETDLVLLSVGKAYYKLGDYNSAEDYFLRTINKTDDKSIEKEGRFKLAEIYTDRNDLLKAEDQYKIIIKLDPESTKAHFQLGEIYFAMNNIIEARAEWRKTLLVDSNHYGAKLRYYK